MKLRLKSDGTPRGTVITDDRGIPLESVVYIQINIDASRVDALIKLEGIEADLKDIETKVQVAKKERMLLEEREKAIAEAEAKLRLEEVTTAATTEGVQS